MVLNPGSSSRHEIPVMRQRSGAVLEAPAFVPGLDDVTVMGEAIEERRGHLWVSEHARPFTEGEIGGEEDRGALVEPADEVEEKLAAGLGERQVAELVEDDEVHAGESIGDAALAPGARLGLKLVDKIDGGEEAPAPPGADAASRNGDHCVRLAGAGSADEHGVALLGDEAAAGEVANEGLVDWRVLEGEAVEVLGERQLGGRDLILDRPRLLLRDLGAQEVADEALRLVLALERGRERLVVGGLHAVELQLAHHVEDFGPLHRQALLKAS